MINQTRIALNTLSAIYGNPEWRGKPSEKDVVMEWDKFFKNYSDEQVKKACLRYAKFKKDGKFPSLACIEAELVDETFNEDNLDKREIANRCFAYWQTHKNECDPVPTELTMKQTIWKLYGVAVAGYNPVFDGELK